MAEKDHHLVVVTRGNAVALLCEDCKLPFLTVEAGRVKVLSKHGAKKHENELSESDLELLLTLVRTLQPDGTPPEFW